MVQHKSETHTAISDKVAAFISKNKIVFWGILVILVISTIVFAVIDKKIKDTNNLYSDKAVEIQKDFQDWFSAPDEGKDEAETTFLQKIDEITSSEKTNILVEKALYLRGQFYMQKEEWDSAYSDFLKIAEISPDSYLASVSLYNAASAKENNGDLETAVTLLNKIVTDYKATSPIVPETLFNIGRINEALDNNISALDSYNELTTSYSSSNWTNLAKTRIISLKASGVSQ